MSSDAKQSTAREALIAELIGDIQLAVDKVGQVDASIKITTAALEKATEQYRQTTDDLVTKLRSETSTMILKTTEHAARELVGQQAKVLEQAAKQAIQGQVFKQIKRENRFNLVVAVIATSAISAILTTALVKLLKL